MSMPPEPPPIEAEPAETKTTAPKSAELRRALLGWAAVVVLLIAAFGSGVAALGRDVYSATGFVQSYLKAVADHDLETAMAMDGVNPHSRRDTTLITAEALGELSDITAVSETEVDTDTRLVTFGYRLAAAGSSEEGAYYESSYLVRETGSTLGFYSTWAFVQSPVQILSVSVRNDWRFTANGLEVDPGEAGTPSESVEYLVVSPGLYHLDHDTDYFDGKAVDAVVTGGESATAVIELEPTEELIAVVQTEVNRRLDECTTQQVLLPSGCPFGKFFSDRIQSVPAWSIADYPDLLIEDSSEGWRVPSAEAAAHLTVEVRSLFDGSRYTFDEDVPFTVAYRVSVAADGVVDIVEVGG